MRIDVNLSNKISWDWPLKIGMTQPEGFSDKAAAETGHWSSVYGKYSIVDAFNERFNLIISRWTPEQLLDENNLRADGAKIECDALILFRESLNEADFENENNRFEELLESYVSGSVSIIYTSNPFQGWIEHFLVELSHDSNLIEALEKSANKSVHVFGESIFYISRLSNFYEMLAKNLVSGDFQSQNILIQNVRFLDNRSYNPDELFNVLGQAFNSLRFDSESNSAADILELNRSIKNVEPGFKIEIEPALEQMIGTEKDIEIGEDQESLNGEDESATKFLQGKIINESFEDCAFLRPETDYKLIVRIGDPAAGWAQGKKGINTAAIFEETDEEVAEILIVYHSMDLEVAMEKTIKLSPGKNSSTAMFDIHSSKDEGKYLGEISAFHKGRLIQKALITAAIVKDGESESVPSVSIDIIMSPRKYLGGLSKRQEFGTSIQVDSSGGRTGITTVKNEKVELVYENALRDKLNSLKITVQNAILGDSKDGLDPENEDFNDIMRIVALKGKELYDSFFVGKLDSSKPIQIVSNLKDYFPLEFIYTYPPPGPESKICKNAEKALKEGKPETCGGCMDINSEDPSELICPFGFVGLRTVIERYLTGTHEDLLSDSKDIALNFEPIPGREKLPILKRTIHGSSARVDKVDAAVSKKIVKKIKSVVKNLFEVDDWDDWKKSVQKEGPDTLLLVVHTEENEDLEQDQMEIGDNHFLLKPFLTTKHIVMEGSPIPPIVILLGCNTTDLKAAPFDFSAQFINKGAAIVLSNFTKITGRKAGRIIENLMEEIMDRTEKEVSLGEITLRLRQRLMAEGNLAGMSLIAHGDADWMIRL